MIPQNPLRRSENEASLHAWQSEIERSAIGCRSRSCRIAGLSRGLGNIVKGYHACSSF
jgi:hypothetical protein